MKKILFIKTIKKICLEASDKAFSTDKFWKTFVVYRLSLRHNPTYRGSIKCSEMLKPRKWWVEQGCQNWKHITGSI